MMKTNKKIFVIVPAYNEEKTLKRVLESLISKNYYVILIDDGSTDTTPTIASEIDINGELHIYSHVINRGLGAALKTGINAALIKGADVIVTFDADGQHDPQDIEKIVKPIITGKADVVIGIRDFEVMPYSKKFGNQIMNALTKIFYGIQVKDSQSGLRAFNNKAAKLINIQSSGYGVSSEIIREIKKNELKTKEIPIQTIYTDYSLSKGTNTKEGIKILTKMIMDILKRV
ncbi:MAG: glycosyltransferase family 2 protein [Methanomicrobiales archaeon]